MFNVPVIRRGNVFFVGGNTSRSSLRGGRIFAERHPNSVPLWLRGRIFAREWRMFHGSGGNADTVHLRVIRFCVAFSRLVVFFVPYPTLTRRVLEHNASSRF